MAVRDREDELKKSLGSRIQGRGYVGLQNWGDIKEKYGREKGYSQIRESYMGERYIYERMKHENGRKKE